MPPRDFGTRTSIRYCRRQGGARSLTHPSQHDGMLDSQQLRDGGRYRHLEGMKNLNNKITVESTMPPGLGQKDLNI